MPLLISFTGLNSRGLYNVTSGGKDEKELAEGPFALCVVVVVTRSPCDLPKCALGVSGRSIMYEALFFHPRHQKLGKQQASPNRAGKCIYPREEGAFPRAKRWRLWRLCLLASVSLCLRLQWLSSSLAAAAEKEEEVNKRPFLECLLETMAAGEIVLGLRFLPFFSFSFSYFAGGG